MRAGDRALAETLLLEYLQVDPNCVPIRELLGRIYEEHGDYTKAVARYAEVIEVLLTAADPDSSSLPAELLLRIGRLAPGSALMAQYRARLATHEDWRRDEMAVLSPIEPTEPPEGTMAELASPQAVLPRAEAACLP